MKTLLLHLKETTDELLETIGTFTEEQLNTIPFAGSWTAGQVAEHLLKAEIGAPEILQGNTQPTTRSVDEKVATIESIFLDFGHKMKSPEFILPGDEKQQKAVLYQAFNNNRATIDKLAANIDLNLTYCDFTVPGLGNLTGIELISFITCHTIRHIHQLKNIHKKLSNSLN